MRTEHQKGFTILELLMAIFLSMIVLAAGYTIFQGSRRATTSQSLDNRMQDNARVAMDMMARNFRRAGFLVDMNKYPLTYDFNGSKVKLLFQPGGSSQPDTVNIIGATVTPLGKLKYNVAGATGTLELSRDVSQVAVDSVIGLGLTYSGVVTGVDEPGRKIFIDTSGSTGGTNMPYPGEFSSGTTTSGKEPARVRMITNMLYRIRTDAKEPLHPVLEQVWQRPGEPDFVEPLAEDIEDLQIAFGVDMNNDRMIQSGAGVCGGGEWICDRALTNEEANRVRLVRITIVARSGHPDQGLIGFSQTIPQIEDRQQRDNVRDGYRRYILTRIVKCRGLDIVEVL